VFYVNFIWRIFWPDSESSGSVQIIDTQKSLALRPREPEKKKEKEKNRWRELIAPCIRRVPGMLYLCDSIITDRRETITSPCRRSCHATAGVIFYSCPGNTDAQLIFFNHGRAASQAVYRGFLTRETHRSLSPSPMYTNERAYVPLSAPHNIIGYSAYSHGFEPLTRSSIFGTFCNP